VNQHVLSVYKKVMAMPEGLSGAEHRKLTRKYVRSMSKDEVNDVLGRRDEIEEASWDEWRLRKDIFLQLGFSDAEAQVFARCRLNSPGIRTLIGKRVEVTKYATDDEIKRINAGDGGTLRGLVMLVKMKGVSDG